MKLSDYTLNVLKNFSSINPSLYVNSGKEQSTLKEDSTVLAEAILDIEFPQSFGIYDLNLFLSNITTLDKPDLTFYETYLEIDDGVIKIKYSYCQPSMITKPKGKKLTIDNPDVTFSLAQTSFSKLLKISALNQLPILTVKGENGDLILSSHVSVDLDTSNFANLKLGDYVGDDFKASFKLENLHLIPDDYDVYVLMNKFAMFENKTKTLKYFIALEKQ